MSDFIIFTRDDGYRFAVERGDVYEVGACSNGKSCIIERRSKGSDIVKGTLEEVLSMLGRSKVQTAKVDHSKTASENTSDTQQPQPAPVPNLVEAVDEYVTVYMDGSRDTTERIGINQAFQIMRLALSRHKEREELVNVCLEILKEFTDSGRSDLWSNAELALQRLDAFDKERGA